MRFVLGSLAVALSCALLSGAHVALAAQPTSKPYQAPRFLDGQQFEGIPDSGLPATALRSALRRGDPNLYAFENWIIRNAQVGNVVNRLDVWQPSSGRSFKIMLDPKRRASSTSVTASGNRIVFAGELFTPQTGLTPSKSELVVRAFDARGKSVWRFTPNQFDVRREMRVGDARGDFFILQGTGLASSRLLTCVHRLSDGSQASCFDGGGGSTFLGVYAGPTSVVSPDFGILASLTEGEVTMRDPVSGEIRWSQRVTGDGSRPIRATPVAVVSGVAVISTSIRGGPKGSYGLFAADTGEFLAWIPEGFGNSPIRIDYETGLIAFGQKGPSAILVYDANRRTNVWSSPDGVQLSVKGVCGGKLWVGSVSEDSNLTLDARTGAVLRRTSPPTVCLQGGRTLVADWDRPPSPRWRVNR